MTMEDTNRPYPEGIAWDEAYRQRREIRAIEDLLFFADGDRTALPE